MPRERWFFAQDHRRRGPVPLETLVESVLGQAEPRSVLVWRKGLVDWARVEDVPELEQRLSAIVARKAAEEAARRAAGAHARASAGAAAPGPGGEARQPGARLRRHRRRRRRLGSARVAVLAARQSARAGHGAAARRHDRRRRTGGRDSRPTAADARCSRRRPRRRPRSAEAAARAPATRPTTRRLGSGRCCPSARASSRRPTSSGCGASRPGPGTAEADGLQRHQLARHRAPREDQPLQGRRLRRGCAPGPAAAPGGLRSTRASPTC